MSDRKIDQKTQNHYETLGLKPNCSVKEVKDAFVNLSKAHHPDLHPNDPSQEQKFVKIYDAYAILSRPEKRVIYDADLTFKERFTARSSRSVGGVETDAPHFTTWKDESIWSMRDKTNFNKDKPYYGIKGINRVSNYWIAGGAVLVMMIGCVFHYIVLKHSAKFATTRLDSKDERISNELKRVRKTALYNGNDVQLKLMGEKFGWTEDNSSSSRGKD